MIAHLCRLAWNRRRTNLLLVAELFLSFLVLTPLVAGWVLFAAEEVKPLGFEYEDVWSVRFGQGRDQEKEDYGRNVELMWREIRALDQVDAAALASEAPFRFPQSWEGITSVYISEEGLEVLGLKLLDGRWFKPGDEALDWTPAVIDQTLSRALFGEEDPLGKAIGDSQVIEVDPQDNSFPIPPSPDRIRVVGVVENCFYYKEYGNTAVQGFVFLRFSMKDWLVSPTQSWLNFLVKPYPDMEPAFGEALRSRVQAVIPSDKSVRFSVESLLERLEADRLDRLYSLGFIAVISGLMILMVALGLTGMMWQTVRRRTREIGIRRAVGAPGTGIYGQFLGELAVLVTAAIALGCLPVFQFGLLELVLGSRVPAWVAASGVGATALVLFSVVMMCGLYPSWLAARVRPAQALHHD